MIKSCERNTFSYNTLYSNSIVRIDFFVHFRKIRKIYSTLLLENLIVRNDIILAFYGFSNDAVKTL